MGSRRRATFIAWSELHSAFPVQIVYRPHVPIQLKTENELAAFSREPGTSILADIVEERDVKGCYRS